MNSQAEWFAVVNPSSAHGKTGKKWPVLNEKLLQAGIEIAYSYTTKQGNGVELTREALNRGYKKIIAVGGDGTANEVLNGLFAEDIPAPNDLELAVLGQGTGSDFIRSCKSQNNIAAFISSLKQNTSLKIDVGKVTFSNEQGQQESRYFLNAANVGIGAEVVNFTNNRTKALGSKFAYLSGTLTTISQHRNFAASLTLDKLNSSIKENIQEKFCGFMICNGQYIGGGMKIAPQAQLNDGLFDVIAVKDITKRRLLSRFPLIYTGKHIGLPDIAVYRCRELFLETAEPVLLETDGEVIGCSPCEFQIIPQCLNLIS